MFDNWPAVTLALALAAAAGYFISDAAARLVEAALRAVIADPQLEAVFIRRSKRVVQLVIFLISAAALAFPALTFAGYRAAADDDPETLVRWARQTGLRIGLIAIAAYFVTRIGAAATRRFEREMSSGSGLDVIERTKRAQTLARMLQKTLTAAIAVIAVLMVLQELDIDITAVLAGAGIVGLAVGFGAQTLVRDVISGFFLILEDQVRVGDVAVVNGQGGLVEALNLRTIVLRDEEGTVHVFPNGEIKTLANRSKDFSYYVITVPVGYDDDPERVAVALREVGDSLTSDADFKPHILEPLDVYGVDAFEAGHLLVKARIKTVPQKQWTVGRELRKRLARTFRERGIHIPVPQMNLRIDRDPTEGGR